ncbi:hypothetical protein D3C77_418990 [compost metagenome]
MLLIRTVQHQAANVGIVLHLIAEELHRIGCCPDVIVELIQSETDIFLIGMLHKKRGVVRQLTIPVNITHHILDGLIFTANIVVHALNRPLLDVQLPLHRRF